MSIETDDLWCESSGLCQHVGGSKASRRTKMIFEDLMAPHLDGIPPVSVMRQIVDAFYALPDAEQRLILNGWRPCPQRPSRRAVQNDQRNESEVRRVLEIVPFHDGDCYIGQTFEFGPGNLGVNVTITEGTSIEDAIAGLIDVLHCLQRQGPANLANDVPENLSIIHEKSDRPESPATPTSGIKREAKALTQAAA